MLIASSSAALILPIVGGAKVAGRPLAELLPQVAIADTACIVALPLVIDPATPAGRPSARSRSPSACVFVPADPHLDAERHPAPGPAGVEAASVCDRVAIALTILFALAALAVLMHVSVLLAGFSFGLAVAALGEPHRLAKQLFALTEGFFGPLFFVWLGASIDLHDLVTHPPAIGLGMALGIAPVVVHGLMAVTGQPVPLALLTAAQLGVPVAAATVGTQLGLLGRARHRRCCSARW